MVLLDYNRGKMIEELLHKLGFTPKEATVYLAILKNGKITPTNLAQATNINRTTVYSVAKELLRRRVITEDLESPKQYLMALRPTELLSLITSEEHKLVERKKTVEEAVKTLEILSANVVYSIPKITFIHEDELNDYLYSRAAVWDKNSLEVGDPTWWGFQDDSFVANYGDWISWYWEKGTSPGIDLKLLSNDSEIEREMQAKGYSNRRIRCWSGLEVDSTTWVVGDYLIMIVTNKRPHYLVEIHDKVLARNQREVFKQIWQTLKK